MSDIQPDINSAMLEIKRIPERLSRAEKDSAEYLKKIAEKDKRIATLEQQIRNNINKSDILPTVSDVSDKMAMTFTLLYAVTESGKIINGREMALKSSKECNALLNEIDTLEQQLKDANSGEQLCLTCNRLRLNGNPDASCSPNINSFVVQCGGYVNQRKMQKAQQAAEQERKQ